MSVKGMRLLAKKYLYAHIPVTLETRRLGPDWVKMVTTRPTKEQKALAAMAKFILQRTNGEGQP